MLSYVNTRFDQCSQRSTMLSGSSQRICNVHNHVQSTLGSPSKAGMILSTAGTSTCRRVATAWPEPGADDRLSRCGGCAGAHEPARRAGLHAGALACTVLATWHMWGKLLLARWSRQCRTQFNQRSQQAELRLRMPSAKVVRRC